MQLQHALLDIAEIRERMASTQVFRGYRAQIAAVSGGLAMLAAGSAELDRARPGPRPCGVCSALVRRGRHRDSCDRDRSRGPVAARIRRDANGSGS